MRKKRSLTGIAILAVLITALALTGCGDDAQQAQTELSEARKKISAFMKSQEELFTISQEWRQGENNG